MHQLGQRYPSNVSLDGADTTRHGNHTQLISISARSKELSLFEPPLRTKEILDDLANATPNQLAFLGLPPRMDVLHDLSKAPKEILEELNLSLASYRLNAEQYEPTQTSQLAQPSSDDLTPLADRIADALAPARKQSAETPSSTPTARTFVWHANLENCRHCGLAGHLHRECLLRPLSAIPQAAKNKLPNTVRSCPTTYDRGDIHRPAAGQSTSETSLLMMTVLLIYTVPIACGYNGKRHRCDGSSSSNWRDNGDDRSRKQTAGKPGKNPDDHSSTSSGGGGKQPQRYGGVVAKEDALTDRVKWEWVRKLRLLLASFKRNAFVNHVTTRVKGGETRYWKKGSMEQQLASPIPDNAIAMITQLVAATNLSSDARHPLSENATQIAQHLSSGAEQWGNTFILSQAWHAMLHQIQNLIDDDEDWVEGALSYDNYGLGSGPKPPDDTDGGGSSSFDATKGSYASSMPSRMASP